MNEIQVANKNEMAMGTLQCKLLDLPQVEQEVRHIFTPGMYTRELDMLRGELTIGCTHRTEHENTLLKGVCNVTMGGTTIKMKAPCTFTSLAGSKKVLLALTDVTWATMHLTDETDLDKLEELLIDHEADERLTLIGKEQLCLGDM